MSYRPIRSQHIVDMSKRGGMNMEIFLREYRAFLKNKRVFYIIQANLDKNPSVVKFGISVDKGEGAYYRLKKYQIQYGPNKVNNSCKGVKVWFIWAVSYNQLVEKKRTRISKLEELVKRTYRSKFITSGTKERGDERLPIHPRSLIKFVRTKIPKMRDTPNVKPINKRTMRPNTRSQAKKIAAVTGKLKRQGSDPANIVKGKRKGKGKTKKYDDYVK